MLVKEIVLLANSRKLSGRCLAGRESANGGSSSWIRPISDRQAEEVSERERQYENGSDPKLLDVIYVPLLAPAPGCHQPENWRLDPGFYWKKVGELSREDLFAFVSEEEPLWFNGVSTFHGENDEMSHSLADRLTDSLRLIFLQNGLSLFVFAPKQAFGNSKRRVLAAFNYAGTHYRLWVTDPEIEREFLNKPNGEYVLGASFLTISVGEPFNGNCYKLVAAIIPYGS